MLNSTEMINYLEQDKFVMGKDELNNIIELLSKLENLESRVEHLNSQKEVGYLSSIDIEEFELTDYFVKELIHNIADFILKNKLYNFEIVKNDSLDVNLYKCELDILKPYEQKFNFNDRNSR